MWTRSVTRNLYNLLGEKNESVVDYYGRNANFFFLIKIPRKKKIFHNMDLSKNKKKKRMRTLCICIGNHDCVIYGTIFCVSTGITLTMFQTIIIHLLSRH